MNRILKKFRKGSATMILGVFILLAFFAFIMMFMEMYNIRENYLVTKNATDTIADGTAMYAVTEDDASITDIVAKGQEIAEVIENELDQDIGTVSIDKGYITNEHTIAVTIDTSFPYVSTFAGSDEYSVRTISATEFSSIYYNLLALGIQPIVGSGKGVEVANFALQFVGNPYIWAGTSLTNGCDCSGFVLSVYANFGVSLPHSALADRTVGMSVSSWDEMQPGDIICFNQSGGYYHVGIYCGNGMMVHAKSSSTGIVYESVTPSYHGGVAAIRRIFVDADDIT